MATKRMLPDVVRLYNYVGEIGDIATYQETVFRCCACQYSQGAAPEKSGRKPNGNATLFLFDAQTEAVSPEGNLRTYLPYQQWSTLEDKGPFWTISDEGHDYFRPQNSNTKFLVTSFCHYVAGSRRMHHFEVTGK